MSLAGKHILSSGLFDQDILEKLFELTDKLHLVAQGRQLCRVLEGAVMGSLFFEPSTRTRLSFDSAFLRLGGSVSSSTGTAITSITKGESIADTIRVISGYCDVIVVRHPAESAIQQIAGATHIPVINGGNGAGEHPTQALLDLYTIRQEFARLEKRIVGSRIALVGDLRHGRAAHSLLKLLCLYQNLTIACVSPGTLSMPSHLLELAIHSGHQIVETDDPKVGLQDADVVYATRIQRERFEAPDFPHCYTSDFCINHVLVNQVCRDDVVIMHPLPRDSREGMNDLSTDLNGDVRLAIFRQTDAGLPVRMALFAMVLDVANQVETSLRPAHWYRPDYIGPDDAPFYMRGWR